MKAEVFVTYRATVDIGELTFAAVQQLIEADGDWNIWETNEKVTVENVEVNEAK